jgi:hypothetical protein
MNETTNNEDGRKYTVNVIDSPCGSGKTEYAMSKLLTQKDKKYFYITPFVSEAERVAKDAKELGFNLPHDYKGKDGKSTGGKTRGCIELLKKGKNICTTHALFSISGKEFIKYFKQYDYTLVLDEMLDVSEDIQLGHGDVNLLALADYIVLPDADHGIVKQGKNKYERGKIPQIEKLMDALDKAEVYCAKGINEDLSLIRQFPPDILKSFKEVWVMTYLFKDQIMYAYLLAHKFDLKFHYVKETTGNKELKDKNFELIEGELSGSGTKFKHLITIHEDVKGCKPLNAIGDGRGTLTSNWWSKNSNDEKLMKAIQDDMHDYKQNHINAKSKFTLWTVFNTYEKNIARNGYKRAFLQHTSKATNAYRSKNCLMYMIDKRPNPVETRLYKKMGVTINEARYSLGHLVQWVFRSAIRDNNPISIYIPSKRMRNILIKWLDGKM